MQIIDNVKFYRIFYSYLDSNWLTFDKIFLTMKKILLFLSVVLISGSAFAQYAGDVSYGFRGGLNYSNLSGDGLDDLESRLGFHGAFFADIHMSDKFLISPELGVSALGVNEQYSVADGLTGDAGDDLDAKTNWLQLTLLAKLNLGEKLYVMAGPQAGVNVTQNDNNDYYNYDFAAVAGVGYRFNGSWSVDVRYGFGLSNIYDRGLGDLSEANNRYFQLGVSYRIFN